MDGLKKLLGNRYEAAQRVAWAAPQHTSRPLPGSRFGAPFVTHLKKHMLAVSAAWCKPLVPLFFCSVAWCMLVFNVWT